MSKGKTKIKFMGGRLDGIIEEDVDTRTVTNQISVETKMWYRKNGEYVEVMKGGRLDNNWMSYAVENYVKGSKDNNGYIEYTYLEDAMVDRCTGITKTGKQCLNAQYKNFSVCRTHKKMLDRSQ